MEEFLLFRGRIKISDGWWSMFVNEFGEIWSLEPIVRWPFWVAVHEVPGVGVSRFVWVVVVTFMHESSWEYCETAFLHLHRNKIFFFEIVFLISLVNGFSIDHFWTPVEGIFVTSWNTPDASILYSCILERNPESMESLWFCIKEGGILMSLHFSSNFWWF